VRPFAYRRATGARAAVAAFTAATGEVMYLGGGTNLADLMRLGVAEPELLIDVSHLACQVEERPGGGIRIGAAARNSDAAADPLIRRRYPVLSQALLNGASGQLRNMATVGGNLLQRTRCGYFQDTSKPCNKRAPGSGCPAVEGDHRNLAIFGHSPACVATHPSDMAVALAALDAVVDVEGPSGRRTIPITGLHRLPGADPARDTVLTPGELITAVDLPPLPHGARSAYRKVRERASFAFAVVSVAAVLELEDRLIRDCRIALGGVAHAPWRAARAEAALRGAPATGESFAGAAEAELAGARPLRDNGYKVPLARDVLVATLAGLAGSQPGGGQPGAGPPGGSERGQRLGGTA
jgi:xanthine dehydrogenase YagS FAD-binding subunit